MSRVATSPRLTPTLALAAAWVAIYLLYLGVRPDPPVPARKATVTTTTTRERVGPEG